MCIYLEIPCKLLQSCDQEEVESLWISMRPHSLPRQITSIVLGVIYHSTSDREPENVILRDHIQKNLDALLLKQPNALVVLTGDFNPTSTGSQAKYIAGVNPLKQLVSFKTRDTGTLDWFFTNRLKLLTLSQLPKVGSSHHYTILAKPVSAPITTHTTEKSVVRDMRDSAWRALGRWITQKDWTPILNASSCEQKFQLLMSELDGAISIFLPQKISKKLPTDRPWVTSKIKMWIGKRQSAFSRHGKDSGAYRHWRIKVQGAIKTAKHHYYQEKVAEIEHVNPRKWWRDIT